MDNLDDVLNGQAPEATAAPETPAELPEQTAAPSTPRDERGRFAPTGEQTPAPAPEPSPVAAPPAAETEANVPIKALQEERRKRQELEAQLEQFRRQPPPSPQHAPQAPAVDNSVPQVFEDEYAQSIFEMAVAHVRQELGPQIHQTADTTRIEMQRLIMGQSTPDFAETERTFFELAQGNPALLQEANRQANPVKWAYDYAKKAQEVRTIGSMDLDAIKKAAVQEYLATNQPPAAPQAIPSSLADAQSARTTATPMAPPSLDQILGRR